MKNDPAHTLLANATAWLAEIIARHPEDFDVNARGQGICVVVADIDSDQPAVQLYVAGKLMGETLLAVVSRSAVN
jgi:hypothetical protein